MKHRGFKDCASCQNKGGGKVRCPACGRKRPYLPYDASKEVRFWSKVDKSVECWLWTGVLYRNGYGQFGYGKGERRAHRIAWMWANGKPVPDGMELDHLCRVRRCVRPAHLEPVTHAENKKRAWKRVCKQGHELTEDNIALYIRPTGYVNRRCKACYTKLLADQKAARLARGHKKKGRPKLNREIA